MKTPVTYNPISESLKTDDDNYISLDVWVGDYDERTRIGYSIANAINHNCKDVVDRYLDKVLMHSIELTKQQNPDMLRAIREAYYEMFPEGEDDES